MGAGQLSTRGRGEDDIEIAMRQVMVPLLLLQGGRPGGIMAGLK